MTRAEHMQWCKQRAREGYDYKVKTGAPLESAIREALASMLSDFRKHRETEGLCDFVFASMSTIKTKEELDKFINDFVE